MIVPGKIALDKTTKTFSINLHYLGIWTQCDSVDGAFFMAGDAIKEMYPKLKFKLQWRNKDKGDFFIKSNDKKIISIVLKEARLACGLTLLDAAKKLGYKNQNSIHSYESGIREPSASKFSELLSLYNIGLFFGEDQRST